MIIKFDNPQFYYDLFYQLSSLIVIFIFLLESFKRKIPWITMLLVVVTTRFFLIVGSKFGGITADDLDYFFQHLTFPIQHSKNMAGALLFALIGLGVAKLLLKIRYPILDVFAIATPFGMAIQRLGCLLTGCCFGNETHLPIGIQYGSNTPAFFHEFHSGRLGLADELSLSVHPVPLYIILYSLLVGILLIKYRSFWKRPGNLALSGLLLILVGWFVIEFFRDPLSNGASLGVIYFGLKKIQIIYLFIMPLLAATIYYREKQSTFKEWTVKENQPLHNSLYLVSLVTLLSITRNWFNTIEFNTLLLVLIPVSIGIIIQVIRHLYSLKVRISVAFLLALSFLLMGQTIPEDEKQTYHSIKIGYGKGTFDSTHDIGTGEGCDRMSNSQDFHHRFNMVGLGYSATEVKNKEMVEYGVNGYFGQHYELGKTSSIETDNRIFSINPFIKYDVKWIGIGGGLHVGNLRFAPAYWSEEETARIPDTGTKKSPVLPQFYFRLGPKNILFASYKFADQFPSPFPSNYQNVEIGSGFSLKNGFNIRFGTDTQDKTYFAAYIPINNKFVFEPFYGWSNNHLNGSSPGTSTNSQFYIGLHYRFAHKTKPILSKSLTDNNN